MAHGHPDFRRGVDIEAQSIATLAIDIAAQTLSDLQVDIVAQSISNLAIDIAAQTLSTLNVDLVAQTLAQLDIDIIAQTIGDLTINIAAQNLSEIINRPKYGAAQSVNAYLAVTANTKTSLVSVSGKGMIYGGMLGMVAADICWVDVPVLKIDGVEITLANFYTINDFRMYKEHCYPFYMLRYDDEIFRYSVGLSRGITFETGFEVLYDEEAGRTPSVACRVIYALV